MRRPKPIKPFKTLEEEANFWDTHDISPLFDNPRVPLSKLPLLESEKEDTLVVRIQTSIKADMNKIAKSRGLSTSTLARMWLIEKLQSYLKRARAS